MSASVAEQVIERSAQDVWAYATDIVRHAGSNAGVFDKVERTCVVQTTLR